MCKSEKLEYVKTDIEVIDEILNVNNIENNDIQYGETITRIGYILKHFRRNASEVYFKRIFKAFRSEYKQGNISVNVYNNLLNRLCILYCNFGDVPDCFKNSEDIKEKRDKAKSELDRLLEIYNRNK